MKQFLANNKGDTNIVSLLILIAVIVVAAIIFRPYIGQFFSWIGGLFS